MLICEYDFFAEKTTTTWTEYADSIKEIGAAFSTARCVHSTWHPEKASGIDIRTCTYKYIPPKTTVTNKGGKKGNGEERLKCLMEYAHPLFSVPAVNYYEC